MSKHVLVILSNHAELAGQPNGTYLPELTHALEALTHAGLTYDLASPQGGAAPGYGRDADALTREMLADPAFAAALESTRPLASVDPAAYDAVFYPGGYGLLFDLVDSAESQRAAAAVYARGGAIAAVCHGPAALANIRLPDGRALVEGRQVTGFTLEEEQAMKTLEKIPFLLEQKLIDAGAVYRKRKAWKELVVEDGRVITGQNPGSARGVGQALAARLLADRGGELISERMK